MRHDWQQLATELTEILRLDAPPVAVSFVQEAPGDVAPFPAPMSEPTPDGRSGRAPASCVFWINGAGSTFSTEGPDHGNCSVGLWVHGFAEPADIIAKEDVGALLDTGWVTMDAVGQITTVSEPAPVIVYGPLGDSSVDPDVVLLRLTPRQMMEFSDACPQVEFSGKPQCQIVAKAKNDHKIAASMGCALSRERTGMPDGELTCAIPADAVPSIVQRLQEVVRIDGVVRSFAASQM